MSTNSKTQNNHHDAHQRIRITIKITDLIYKNRVLPLILYFMLASSPEILHCVFIMGKAEHFGIEICSCHIQLVTSKGKDA